MSTLDIEFIHDVFIIIICNRGTPILLFHNTHFAEILYQFAGVICNANANQPANRFYFQHDGHTS